MTTGSIGLTLASHSIKIDANRLRKLGVLRNFRRSTVVGFVRIPIVLLLVAGASGEVRYQLNVELIPERVQGEYVHELIPFRATTQRLWRSG